ncbi:MAG: SCO family protein [Saprospiraceae bacterium]|nr:SCO family protein [Saprospiraceae bacterium]
MKKFNINTNIFILMSLAILISCGPPDDPISRVDTLPYYDEATFTPHWFDPKDEILTQFHHISLFKLINQDGDTISENTFNEKIYITNFFFTVCPGICPKMTSNMTKLQEAFLEDNDVLLLSHSVTPERDSVPVLKKYADKKGVISDKWHLVTGDQQEIYKLGRKDYFVEEDLGLQKSPDEFLHTENFILIDKNRHIRGTYNGLNKTSVEQLIADVRTLQKER